MRRALLSARRARIASNHRFNASTAATTRAHDIHTKKPWLPVTTESSFSTTSSSSTSTAGSENDRIEGIQAVSPEHWKLWAQLDMRDEMDKLKLSTFLGALADAAFEQEMADKDKGSKRGMASMIERQEAEMAMRVIDQERLVLNVDDRFAEKDVRRMMKHFSDRRDIQKRTFENLLHRVGDILAKCKNVTEISEPGPGMRVTVVGDLHGSIDDLATIFDRAGWPGPCNQYVFNGDFVDRGEYGVEILCVLFGLKIIHPEYVHLNRGNHEDPHIGRAYGFYDEVMNKFASRDLYDEIQAVFRQLPLCAIVEDTAFICHAGLFRDEKVDLDTIKALDRAACVRTVGENDVIEDLTWSDPAISFGDTREPNFLRRAGTLFGPDVAKQWLDQHNLDMVVRSHQCVPEGAEVIPLGDGKSLYTIFSSSNYGGSGNMGAVLVLEGGKAKCTPTVIKYDTELADVQVMLQNKNKLVKLICEHKGDLATAFRRVCEAEDFPGDKTTISLADWAEVMQEVLQLEANWRALRPSLTGVNAAGRIDYQSFLNRFQVEVLAPGAHKPTKIPADNTATQDFFRSRRKLEAIFHFLDADHTGSVSRQELVDGCALVNARLPEEQRLDAQDVFRFMDIDDNETLDFREFCRLLGEASHFFDDFDMLPDTNTTELLQSEGK